MKKTYITPIIAYGDCEFETTFLLEHSTMKVFGGEKMNKERYNKFDNYQESEYGDEQL